MVIRIAPEDDGSSEVIRIDEGDDRGWELRRAWAVRRVDGDPGEPYFLALDLDDLADLLGEAWGQARSAIADRAEDGPRAKLSPKPKPILPTEPAA